MKFFKTSKVFLNIKSVVVTTYC